MYVQRVTYEICLDICQYTYIYIHIYTYIFDILECESQIKSRGCATPSRTTARNANAPKDYFHGKHFRSLSILFYTYIGICSIHTYIYK